MTQRELSLRNRTPRLRGAQSPAGDNYSSLSSRSNNAELLKRSGSNRAPKLSIARLERLMRDYLLDGECRYHSQATLDLRGLVYRNLIWFYRNRWLIAEDAMQEGATITERDGLEVNIKALRGFFNYLRRADSQGKWGNPSRVAPAAARTVATYDNHIRSLFSWLKKQGEISSSPMDAIEPTIARRSQIAVFTPSDIAALLEAARRSMTGRRDLAIVMFLLDTGVRANELCTLKVRDVDFDNRRVTVLGKGNKSRGVCFGRQSARALWKYLEDGRRRGDGAGVEADQPLFRGIKGNRPGSALTPSGLLDMIRNLGKSAGVKGVRCSPHTFRHTFATTMIRSGVPAFSLREMLGHTSLHQTQQYVSLVQSDIETQYRANSVVDKMFG